MNPFRQIVSVESLPDRTRLYTLECGHKLRLFAERKKVGTRTRCAVCGGDPLPSLEQLVFASATGKQSPYSMSLSTPRYRNK